VHRRVVQEGRSRAPYRTRHKQFVAARGAAHSRKPVREDAAGEVALELATTNRETRAGAISSTSREGLSSARTTVECKSVRSGPPPVSAAPTGAIALACRPSPPSRPRSQPCTAADSRTRPASHSYLWTEPRSKHAARRIAPCRGAFGRQAAR